MHDSVDAILRYNNGREAQRLALKYWAMRQDAFAFLRGSCHLFYRDWPASERHLNKAPLGWICGDLHLENFGCYKGDNRLVYFDLNDFDEAALAPASWELGRWLTSIIVASRTLKFSRKAAIQLCGRGLDSYATALSGGKARWLERETATGMIRDLLDPLKLRKRKAFLASRTVEKKGRRKIKIDGRRALELSPEDKKAVMSFAEEYARHQPRPSFFRPLDAARRIAGTGSLGLDRYVILVEGRGSPDANYLVDLKEAIPSALQPYLRIKQPKWQDHAQRISSVQNWAQAIAPAFLSAVTFNGKSYLYKGLQPTQDRLALEKWNGKIKRLEQVVCSMGEMIAWSHLRSGGRDGSAITDEWIAFGNEGEWKAPLIEYAINYSAKVVADWTKYCREYDRNGADWTASNAGC